MSTTINTVPKTAGGAYKPRPLHVRVRHGVEPFVVGGIALLCLLVLLSWRLIVVIIPPGHVGVLYSLFGGGTVMEYVIPEGIAFKWPWNTIYVLETREQVLPIHVDTLSEEGLPIGVDATVIFQIKGETANLLLKQVGTQYIDRIVYPTAVAAVRKEVAIHDTHRSYTFDTSELTAEILSYARGEPKSSLIQYDDVLIRTIILPKNMQDAIEHKLTQEQVAAAYEFILARARSEADRKRIEAIGLENYYSIIARSLSKDVLTWSGIQATLALAKSDNSKVVVVGGGQSQMPIILGSDIANAAPAAPSPAQIPIDADKLSLPPPESPVLEPVEPPKGVGVPGKARITPHNGLPPHTPEMPQRAAPDGPAAK